MDVFDELFRGVRAHGAVFGSARLTAPWSLDFVDGSPLTLCSVLEGAGWIVPDGHPPVPLRARETAVVRGPGTFRFVDDPDTAAAPVPCGQDRVIAEPGAGHRRAGGTTLVVGAYPVRGDVGRRLLDALPVVVPPTSGGAGDAVLDHLLDELATEVPGSQVVLDRLLDWGLVCTLREWFDRPDGRPPAWWAAQRDPVVGTALRLLHADPAAPWTVTALARRCRVSRATLAKRFTDLVGEPPFAYLTGRRMAMAADLLVDRPAATVAEVAREVGYADPFGFSAAFKRVRGVGPREFRRAAAAVPLVSAG